MTIGAVGFGPAVAFGTPVTLLAIDKLDFTFSGLGRWGPSLLGSGVSLVVTLGVALSSLFLVWTVLSPVACFATRSAGILGLVLDMTKSLVPP